MTKQNLFTEEELAKVTDARHMHRLSILAD